MPSIGGRSSVASVVTDPVCGGTWLTQPATHTGPPSTVPSYVAIVVTSDITEPNGTISGNIVTIVIVKTNPGYSSNPLGTGTGTIVATLCG